MKKLHMPRNLDDGQNILYWAADEVIPGLAVFMVGMLINQKLFGLIGAILVVKMYRKLKEGKPNGFLLHTLYWHGVINPKSKIFPNPFIREYLP